jgi:hypothetical protein
MNIEKMVNQIEEILNKSSCFISVEDEILKLLSLFKFCSGTIMHQEEEYISRAYVLEKVERIREGVPIVLGGDCLKAYIRWKLEGLEIDSEPGEMQ